MLLCDELSLRDAGGCLRCPVWCWEVVKVDSGINSLFRVGFHRFTDDGQEIVSQHTIAPDDLCLRIAVTHSFQEISDCCSQDLLTSFMSRVPAHSLTSSAADWIAVASLVPRLMITASGCHALNHSLPVLPAKHFAPR